MNDKKPKGWQPGQSGNPTGKKPGSGQLQQLRASIAADVPEILAGLVEAAKGGDMQAARLILERVLPAIKPIEQALALTLPTEGTLTAQGRAVLAAVADGAVAPSQGAQLLAAISSLARVTEVDELLSRIVALEVRNAEGASK